MTQQQEMYYAIKEAIQVLEKDFIKKYVEIDSDGREVVLLSDIEYAIEQYEKQRIADKLEQTGLKNTTGKEVLTDELVSIYEAQGKAELLQGEAQDTVAAGGFIEHVCGAQGFNPMLGDTCNGCETERKSPEGQP